MTKLTDLICRNAACADQKLLKLGDGNGLYLWVYEDGRKRFHFRYKYHGKAKGLVLGAYPGVGLAEARKEARRMRAMLDEGIDPSAERRRESSSNRIRSSNDDLFENVGREWYEKQSMTWTLKHAQDVQRRLEKNIFPHIGRRPIDQIDGPELLAVMEKMEKRGATDLAHRVNAVCGQVFRYGIATGRCKHDVAASIVDALTPHKARNQPCVDLKNVPKLIQDINSYEKIGDRQTQLGLKLLAHMFPRTSELIAAKKSEFDLEQKVWEVPAERMKMSNDHMVPLTEPVIGYLRELIELSGNSEYLLPGRNMLKHTSNNTLLFALYRMGYKGKMTGHGFRAMASTILNESGWNSDWIERQLAHVEENRVRGAYNRAMYLNDRRRMMEWWSQYLVALEDGRKPAMPDL